MKITGVGPVTPAGIGRDAFWKGILEPVSRVRAFEQLGSEWGPFIATTVDDAGLEEVMPKTLLPKHLARHSWFAAIAGILALRDAGISPGEINPEDFAVVTGTSLMDFGGISHGAESFARRGLRGVSPRLVYSTSVANVPAAILHATGVNGRAMAVQSSCCSGMDAIAHGADLIASGAADIVIAGGAEAPLFIHPLLEFRLAGLTPATWENAEKHCRPFDLWRTTGTIGEGAAMLVLEPEDSPRNGYGFIAGYGNGSDGPTALCGGLVEAMEHAIASAGLRPCDIDVLSAWAPGHREIDAAESGAIHQVFGGEIKSVMVGSIKGSVGNALGAAPALQVAVAALGLQAGEIPPTVNWSFPDPACDLPLSNRAEKLRHQHCLVNAHGLAGVNSAMVLSRS
ncbi:beta-ketoacyl-[acyl-carrier-protein] synthase family protein [Actomonas aquatica]|uniref:Beta-ketoacyl synthase N-terminal-like domain-containing protein n=1 Tax=Actomonas aquatica TaxID=2866162 RepID=A0ABZ1CAT0_9BACT|nr:beta-ketoacyl synthase N-terminal-like domain-containing protein [Opitutus sp. WL0086]WRQ88781.1 beta-ketoacyl synthase N-terminal-like domain-containing protein [Opitutus sp. WL0086]